MENSQDLDKKYRAVSTTLKEELKLCSDLMSEEDYSNSKSQTKNMDSNEDTTSRTASNFSTSFSSNSESFCFAEESIPNVSFNDQELLDLGVNAYDQTQFETEIISQVDKALKAEEEHNRVADANKELHFVEEDIQFIKNHLNKMEKKISTMPNDPNLRTVANQKELAAIKKEHENKLKQMKKLETKRKALQVCISGNVEEVNTMLQRNSNENEEEIDEETLYHLERASTAKETEEERLIRTGEMTPFGTVIKNQAKGKPKPKSVTISSNSVTEFEKFLLSQAEEHQHTKTISKKKCQVSKDSPSKSSDFMAIKSDESSSFQGFTDLKAVSRKKSKILSKIKLGSKHAKGFSKQRNFNRSLVKNYKSDSCVSDIEHGNELDVADDVNNYSSDDVYIPDKCDWDDNSSDDLEERSRKKNKDSSKSSRMSRDNLTDSNSHKTAVNKKGMKKLVDDGNQKSFLERIRTLEKSNWMEKQLKLLTNGELVSDEDDVTEFEEGYKIPNSIWNKLYKYQQTGVHWLWELHQENCGGIVGDEMGLGKTIQVIAFLIGLKYSNLRTVGDCFKGLGPVILVCPATVMHQWVKEFHTWWPIFRVAILHQSGSFVGKKEFLIQTINKNKGILITSYTGIVQHQKDLLKHEWHYVILDEGHKICNPDAQATLVVKQFRTPHRLILSDSPIQNNLKELWSLFDFIFPGKLGTLPVFMQEFSVPIMFGGYSNATQVQVQILAYKFATVLRDTIKPYLLRRMKSDVQIPYKNEQVLFCKLTKDQEELYKGYINSKEVESILSARLEVFIGLKNLRKICNHPDIFGGPKIFKDTDEDRYGYYEKSGKMVVVEALLGLWRKQGHRVLLFTQSKQMLEIFEIFVKSKNYKYMKMDGTTSISSRQPAVAKFNSDSNIFVFLLTTRVRGIGVNLTGADRIIIYDSDWNPVTDALAREPSWGIDQSKQVAVYWLLTAGTIEEKNYHRQIFKRFMTDRGIKDPKQRRFFESTDLYELFTYQDVGKQDTETSAILGTTFEINLKKKVQEKNKKYPKEQKSKPRNSTDVAVFFSKKKQEEMKMLAKKLSQQLPKCNFPKSSETSLSVDSETTKELDGNGCNSTPSAESQSVEKPLKEKSGEKTLKGSLKRKAAKVEGEIIDYVVKKKVFKPTEEDKDEHKNEDYILSKFEKSGVHTALKHDVVELSAPDYSIVKNEADRVASEAIKALKASRTCVPAAEEIPTGTDNMLD